MINDNLIYYKTDNNITIIKTHLILLGEVEWFMMNNIF